MAILSTLSGWVAVIALGGGYYYYVKDKKGNTPVAKQLSKLTDTKEPKTKKAPAKSEKPARKKTQPPVQKEEEKSQGASTAVSNDRDDEVDNREFARQISNIKSGVLPTSKAKTEKKQKSVKQSKAQESKVAAAESSDNATGGDADDDESSVNSPELKASADTTPVTSGGVSDMLEASSSGPQILKITEPTNPVKPKKAKPQTFEAVESKKARQNRKKTEAAKEARAEEEKARKVLEEKQRRTAREAEGRAAKDGSTFMASKAPAQSAWVPPALSSDVSGTTKGVNGTDPANTHIQLLDTYEPSSKKAETPSQTQAKGEEWQKTLPSEEEQLRIAVQESDEWQTVKGKKQQEKKKPAAPAPVEPVAAPTKEKADFSTVAAKEPTNNEQKPKNTTSHTHNGVAAEKEEEFQDSEWEVA